ncbi:phosphate metabolism protein 7 [Cryptotrichosporon argae]
MSNTNADTNAATTGSFVSALVTGCITVGVCAVFWLAAHNRRSLRRVFQPRLELAPESKRPVELPDQPVGFWKTVYTLPDSDLISINGPDAYFFARFLKVFGLYMLVPYFLLTFIILLPVSAAGQTAGLTQLNMFTFGNVASNRQVKHVAHFLVALILMSWTLYLLWHEYNHFVEVRQAWLRSPQHVASARTRTVALVNVPSDMNSETGLRELASQVAAVTGSAGPSAPRRSEATEIGSPIAHKGEQGAGGVTHIWLGKKVKDVEKVWAERDKECGRLEGGIGKLLKVGQKNERKGKTPEKKGKVDEHRAGATMVDRFVKPKKQPTWKQGPLGLWGKKMTLESSPVYIREHNDQLRGLREKQGDLELGNVAFVRFATQEQAHQFARLASSTSKQLRMLNTGIELIPEDVVWSNISMNPYQRKIRTLISWALTIGLIIIWAIPVAFVGVVSNVDSLCANASWLAWICKIPGAALGIIKGVLPSVLLAVLFMLLPIVLRLWIKLQGEVRKSDIELKLFTRYWDFQIIHGFIIVTISSGLINALGNLGNTASSVPTLLADKLPGASIFFLTYVLTATWASAAKAFARLIPTVMWMLRGILAGGTPRKAFAKTYKMGSIRFSETWPPVCLLLCITVVYSVIQPFITIIALIAFGLLFSSYKYLLFYTTDQPASLETGGLYYIKALRTVFVTLYLEQICLAGLFFLSTDQNGSRTASGIACGIIIVIMGVITALMQAWFDHFRFKRSEMGYISSVTGGPRTSTSLIKLPLREVTSVDEHGQDEAELAGVSGDDHAFDHPCLWAKQPVIWIADDPLGLGRFEAERVNDAGVEASTEYAHMDTKGNVSVERGPPDENWYGGVKAL